jgi:hypothetical protein
MFHGFLKKITQQNDLRIRIRLANQAFHGLTDAAIIEELNAES